MDSLDRLQLRLNSTTADDTMVGFLLTGALEHLREKLGAAPINAIEKQVIGDKEFFPFFKVPVSWFLETVRRAAVLPGVAPDVNVLLRDVADGMVKRGLDSPLGKTIALLGSKSPHKLITSGTSAKGMVFTFGESTYTQTGEQSGSMHVVKQHLGPTIYPAFLATVIRAVCRVEPQITVQVKNETGSDFDMNVRW